MALETASFISQLVATNPTSGDPKSEGDNHLRVIKAAVLGSFPSLGAVAVTATAAQLNVIPGSTAQISALSALSTAQIAALATPSAAQIAGLAAVTPAELGYVAGVTSALQTQINAKAALASPTFTGTVTIPSGASIAGFAPLASPALTGVPTAPTATTGTATAQLATTAFVGATAFNAALPSQTGNSGKFVTTDGSNASWALPIANQTSNSGKYLTTNGTTTSWGTVSSSGAGGTTLTGNVTLTSASAAAMTVTPATPGLYATLPDATTCTKADNLYAIYNAGDFDYGVKDSAGTQLGWVRARTGAMIGLSDSSTAAGVWAYYGLEKTGITASYINTTLTNMSTTGSEAMRRITVDSDRTAFLFGGTDCYVIVYNQTTQTWGSATLVRATVADATYTGVLAATDKLLVCSCDSTTGMETVTISLSNVTATVNSGTKATTVLAGNITGSGNGFGQIIAVSTSWVVTYSRATTTTGIRAITVSGTTPTVGAESAISASVAGLANLYASGSIVRTVCLTASTTLSCTPYTVSTSTLSVGTAATAATTSGAAFRTFVNGNGNIVANYANSNHSAAIFKLTTTTEAVSTAVLSTTAPNNLTSASEFAVVSASKTAYISHAGSTTWYSNILTDTAGTASVGTEITGSTVGNMAGLANFGVSGNTVRFGYGATPQHGQFTPDCSGTSPVLSSVIAAIYSSSTASMANPSSSNRYGAQAGNQLSAGAVSIVLGGNASVADYLFTAGCMHRAVPLLTIPTPVTARTLMPRASNGEMWVFGPVATITVGMAIQRLECAA